MIADKERKLEDLNQLATAQQLELHCQQTKIMENMREQLRKKDTDLQGARVELEQWRLHQERAECERQRNDESEAERRRAQILEANRGRLDHLVTAAEDAMVGTAEVSSAWPTR